MMGFLFSALCVLGISVILNAPFKSLIWQALISGIGFVFYALLFPHVGEVFAVFAASIVIMFCAHIMARKIYIPTTIFIVCCHYPYVPGAYIYRAVFSLFTNDYGNFEHNILMAVLISGAIAFSIFLMDSLFSIKLRKKFKLMIR